MFVMYARANMPNGDDINWLLSFGKRPAHRFNWGRETVVLGGRYRLGYRGLLDWFGLELHRPRYRLLYPRHDATGEYHSWHWRNAIRPHIDWSHLYWLDRYRGRLRRHVRWLDDVHAGGDHRGKRSA